MASETTGALEALKPAEVKKKIELTMNLNKYSKSMLL
jgi:hypothetical protein